MSIPPPPPPPLIDPSSYDHLLKRCGIQNPAAAADSDLNEDFYNHIEGLINRDLLNRSAATEQYDDDDSQEHNEAFVVASVIKPVLQNGPLCGLVALSMASQLIAHVQLDPNEILGEAIKKGFSRKGEMFSAENICNLAESLMDCQSQIIDTKTDGAEEMLKSFFVDNCFKGNPILMPYDADFNHRPTSKRNGHAVHWAIIFGIILIIKQDNHVLQEELKNLAKLWNQFQIKNSQYIHIIHIIPQQKSTDNDSSTLSTNYLEKLVKSIRIKDISVITYQGKSNHPGVWSLQELIKSNQNLKEISPKILSNKDDYALFDIQKCLCSKAVVIKNKY